MHLDIFAPPPPAPPTLKPRPLLSPPHNFFKMTEEVDPEKIKYEHFDARYYLEHYYSSTCGFEGMIKQFVEFYSAFPEGSLTVLNYAGGPSIEPLIFAAEKTREYVHADFAKSSRDEVDIWIRNDPGAFDWKNHAALCLQIEGREGTKLEVETRERRMRSAFKAAVFCDILTESPEVIDGAYKGPYDVVHCIGCMDLCPSYDAFAAAVRKLSNLVNPGGFLQLEMGVDTEVSTIQDTYVVGDTVYAKRLHVTKGGVLEALRLAGMTPTRVYEYVEDNEATAGYKDNILLVFGQKSGQASYM